ncbi:MAG: hypothetical protein PQJ60_13310, partial [Spirochaetales bacterium]|nr:hypothetical protein [Spirochaetales bacterium]
MTLSLAAFGLWANGSTEFSPESARFSMEGQDYEPIHEITVEPTDEILALFESFGIDSYYLLEETHVREQADEKGHFYTTPPPVTQEVKKELALILSENRGNVVDMINAELYSHLRRDKIEAAHMTIGSYYFTASLDYPEA